MSVNKPLGDRAGFRGSQKTVGDKADDNVYKGQDILVIGRIGDNPDKADKVVGLVYTKDEVWEREGKADRDLGKFWHLSFGEATENRWHQVWQGGMSGVGERLEIV